MPDFTEALGQDMQQKTVYELLWRKQHGFLFVVVGSIQISEGDPVIIYSFNPVIGDRDLVRVTCQVFDDRIRILERIFRMHNPIGFIELFLQLPKIVILFQVADLSLQSQLFGFVKRYELLEKFAPECLGYSSVIKQEVPAAFGALPVAGIIQTSCRNNTMDMRMIKQGLCPSVQNSNHAHSCHEPLSWVFGKIIQCLPGAAKQNIVDQSLVLITNGSQLRRQCEYHMEILYVQQVVCSLKNPLFLVYSLALWAMTVAAGIVIYLNVAAGRAGRHMTTQDMSPALTDIPDEFLLFKAQDSMFSIVISKAVEHFCHGSHSYCSQASKGLKALESGTSLTCRYIIVVCTVLWPNRYCRVFRFMPSSRAWEAKQCRRT